MNGEFFKLFSSNTEAGSANRLFFVPETEIFVGRVFYRIAVSGEYCYSLLFSDTIDSTYADGSISSCNMTCGGWQIHGAKVWRLPADSMPQDFTNPALLQELHAAVTAPVTLRFEGAFSKNVERGALFACDPFVYTFEKGDYLCLEISFSGTRIPYHEESVLPCYVRSGEGWVPSKRLPFPAMIGCDRQVTTRVAYLGDSITQGIGATPNSYRHWSALLSERLGYANRAFWNLGIGYARANDAATDGAWLHKVKQNDIIFVCLGVNDMWRFSEQQIKSALCTVVDTLRAAHKRIILQTVPPFDYDAETAAKWRAVNTYIRDTLSQKTDLLFDNVPYLGISGAAHMAKYGGHPNDEGSAVWAEALYRAVCDSGIFTND